jgi:hypothetical protein
VSGTVHVRDMNNLSGGNLNIASGGTFVLDPTGASGPTWAQFAAARAWGTGNGQVQLSGGLFAARNGDVAIDLDDISGAPANYFNSNFTLGNGAKQANGAYYANRIVNIVNDINLTATRTITLLHAGPGLTGNRLAQAAQGELSGDISGTGP